MTEQPDTAVQEAREWFTGETNGECADAFDDACKHLRNLLAAYERVEAERDAAHKAVSHLSQQAHLEWTRAEQAEQRVTELEAALREFSYELLSNPGWGAIEAWQGDVAARLDQIAALKGASDGE